MLELIGLTLSVRRSDPPLALSVMRISCLPTLCPPLPIKICTRIWIVIEREIDPKIVQGGEVDDLEVDWGWHEGRFYLILMSVTFGRKSGYDICDGFYWLTKV